MELHGLNQWGRFRCCWYKNKSEWVNLLCIANFYHSWVWKYNSVQYLKNVKTWCMRAKCSSSCRSILDSASPPGRVSQGIQWSTLCCWRTCSDSVLAGHSKIVPKFPFPALWKSCSLHKCLSLCPCSWRRWELPGLEGRRHGQCWLPPRSQGCRTAPFWHTQGAEGVSS